MHQIQDISNLLSSKPFIRHAISNKGFTLIEVMVTVAVISLGVVAVMGGMARTVRAARHAAAYGEALRLLEAKLFEVATNSSVQDEAKFCDTYACRISRSRHNGGQNVTVAVSWMDERGEQCVSADTTIP